MHWLCNRATTANRASTTFWRIYDSTFKLRLCDRAPYDCVTEQLLFHNLLRYDCTIALQVHDCSTELRIYKPRNPAPPYIDFRAIFLRENSLICEHIIYTFYYIYIFLYTKGWRKKYIILNLPILYSISKKKKEKVRG